MVFITLNDLAVSEDLDHEAMQSLTGGVGEGNWVLGAFPAYVTPVPAEAQMFNLYQQVTNNYTSIGQVVNQTTNVDITNSGANSTNNAVLMTSLGNAVTKS
jgi:hypothetical protein